MDSLEPHMGDAVACLTLAWEASQEPDARLRLPPCDDVEAVAAILALWLVTLLARQDGDVAAFIQGLGIEVAP